MYFKDNVVVCDKLYVLRAYKVQIKIYVYLFFQYCYKQFSSNQNKLNIILIRYSICGYKDIFHIFSDNWSVYLQHLMYLLTFVFPFKQIENGQLYRTF